MRDCTAPRPIAFQVPLNFLPVSPVPPQAESEDCLYVNVYKKLLTNSANNRKLPVLIMLHSGGFSIGTSNENMQGPDFLLEHDILYVSVNYRLGPFGFLSIPDREFDIPGNAGLKDQSLALRWVSENCVHFGGDRENITLMGLSAGAAGVHFHLISDHSKDLFHRAIVQSGSAFCPWATQPSNRDITERLARALGWNGASGKTAMFRTIIDAPAELISQHVIDLYSTYEHQNGQLFLFVPIVEPYDNGTVFVDRDVPSMNVSAWGHRIPMIVGGNSGEGYIMYGHTMRNERLFSDRSYFDNAVPRELGLSEHGSERRCMGDVIRRFYYGDETPTIQNVGPYADMLTDKHFWHGIYAIVLARQAHAKSAPTYLYYFDYSSDVLTPIQMLACGKHVERMVHADDVLFQYRIPGVNDQLTKDCVEVRLRNIYVSIHIFRCNDNLVVMLILFQNTLLTSFATTGIPTMPATESRVVWEPVSRLGPVKCLNIAEQLSVIDLPHEKRVQFWETICNSVKQADDI